MPIIHYLTCFNFLFLLIEDFAWALHDRMQPGGDNAQMFDVLFFLFFFPPGINRKIVFNFFDSCDS